MDKQLNINDYKYNLSQDKIALYPLEERDHSKLLVYKNGHITHSSFNNLSQFLPENSILFFNNTKVIPARLIFHKDTGASIELFLLNPILPSPLVSLAMESKGCSQWRVTIGNAKRWNDGKPLVMKVKGAELIASLIDKEKGIVKFSWSPESLTFAEIISKAGATPLPPYLKREVEASDRERYQTVYSKNDGAVAAPTAGLHFTNNVFASLKSKNIETDFLTLHVSAGTFQPVKVENALDHIMHAEQIVISKSTIENLLEGNRKTIAVGTTSLRTLESLYWYGVMLQANPDAEFIINQDRPYLKDQIEMEFSQAIEKVYAKMERDQVNELIGETSIYIIPGYTFKSCEALITNFHQPGSTLMLLVAAFVGTDWKEIYEQALQENYRFLSFGDSSLLFRLY